MLLWSRARLDELTHPKFPKTWFKNQLTQTHQKKKNTSFIVACWLTKKRNVHVFNYSNPWKQGKARSGIVTRVCDVRPRLVKEKHVRASKLFIVLQLSAFHLRLLWLRNAIIWHWRSSQATKNDRNVQNDRRFFNYVRHVLRFKTEFSIFPKPVCFASFFASAGVQEQKQSFDEILCVHQIFASFYDCQEKLPHCSCWRKMSSDEVPYAASTSNWMWVAFLHCG